MALAIVTVGLVMGGLYSLSKTTVGPLQEYAGRLQENSGRLEATASQSSTNAQTQSSMASQIGVTVEEITQTSAAAADSAQEIVAGAEDALEKSQQGQTSVEEARVIMSRIGQVARLVDTVTRIAEQSNLLAVNASIEAAGIEQINDAATMLKQTSEDTVGATREIEGVSASQAEIDVQLRRLIGGKAA